MTVFYTLSGSAREGSDYTITPTPAGRVIIPAGQKSATIVAHILTDGVKEKKESFTLTLTNNRGYSIQIKANRATVTIAKNNT